MWLINYDWNTELKEKELHVRSLVSFVEGLKSVQSKPQEKQSTTKKSLTQVITALSGEEFVNAYVWNLACRLNFLKIKKKNGDARYFN